MPDQLYLSYRLRGFTGNNMLRHYEKMLRLFPYSRLSRRGSLLRVLAVSLAEPALLERTFEPLDEVDGMLAAAREFLSPDCAIEIETAWDLWTFDNAEWKLAPAPVTMVCRGPEFDRDDETDLQINLGLDIQFLPRPDLPNFQFMSQSNIRSVLQLAAELDRVLTVQSRRLWTDAGEDFADRLGAILVELGSDS